ncbi:hypothetical protein [Hyphomicrobium sp. LHD-15]|uniref:hypothetical protein n=1 Tax=Hyphomicrobium sp. LHD-15 TaxID=3072142 RepID=UPI00280DD8EA|nr:hypothetical protein [Hyphomicrobium sp. LHD-15]MDQ8700225.1 hypothetical protein [Hyphomicrobium sp. LHD-15]
MSVRVMTLVWDAEFPTPVAKLIALKHADCSHDNGSNVFPSNRTVARDTGCSLAVVKRWNSIFDACGLLIADERSSGGAWKNTTVRRFDLKVLRALAMGTAEFVLSAEKWSIEPTDRTGPDSGPVQSVDPFTEEPGHELVQTWPSDGPKPSTEPSVSPLPPKGGLSGYSGNEKVAWLAALRESGKHRDAVDGLIAPLLASNKRLSLGKTPLEALAEIAAAAHGIAAPALTATVKRLCNQSHKLTVVLIREEIGRARKGGAMVVIRPGTPQWQRWVVHFETADPRQARAMVKSGVWQVMSEWPPAQSQRGAA